MTDHQSNAVVNPDPFLMGDWQWQKYLTRQRMMPQHDHLAASRWESKCVALGVSSIPISNKLAHVEFNEDNLVLEKTMCRKFNQATGGVWVLRTNSNGTRLAQLRCLICGAQSGTTRKASTFAVELPVYEDGAAAAPPCARCGSCDGTELHHWAPRHLFPDDAWHWPTSYLCPTCHRLWHRVVTPDMGKRKAS